MKLIRYNYFLSKPKTTLFLLLLPGLDFRLLRQLFLFSFAVFDSLALLFWVKVKKGEKTVTDLKSGDQVVKGQEIGYITDVFGKPVADISADQNGSILYKAGIPPVNEGETLLCIGYNTALD
ncbi:hypothetical protein L0663_02080 [Dyadobacter sp. CY107]|uniref:hypothetical protein n=1 Tax=Dyadobacter fanqingshengii TaxID=2906443 RepID=UPI001F252EC4|nr:hypothetical protein [Dyadobacter fanqingshengii]MCF2502152.1 hypothetical protein [Dyadobacter fanqingshengii]